MVRILAWMPQSAVPIFFLALLGMWRLQVCECTSPESTTTQTTCLSGAVPQASRKPAFDEVAVQLATYSWESSRITSSIARIIMEERMGLLVDQAAVLGGSHLGPPALAGGPSCVADDGFQACDANTPTAHFVFDAWGGGEKSYNLMDSSIRPIMGPMGYMGQEGTFVPDSAIQQGLRMSPRAFLDFYKSYNSLDLDVSKFMASRAEVQAKIEELGLMKANCTRAQIPQAHAGCAIYENVTGDHSLYTWQDDGQGTGRQCQLVCDDNWILSPACRRNPQACVAWVTTGDGWGVEEILQQAVFWNMALAVVVLPDWGHYTRLPLEVASLWFWFFPDPSFMALDPVKLLEPPTDHGERASRIYRTGADSIVLHKFQWKHLPTFAPQVHTFLEAVEFTRADIVELMRNASLKQPLDDIACAWVRQQEQRWENWLPQPDLCAAGWSFDATEGRCTRCSQGTFSTGPGGQNASCQLCAAGSYSNALGASACTSCPLGRFSYEPGQTECTACVSGTYGAAAGLTACSSCSHGSDADLWTTMRLMTQRGSTRWVTIDGATSPESCGCDFGARWRNEENGTACIACDTEGMQCVGMGDIVIEEGYMSSVPVSVFKCFGDHRRCSGGLPGDTCKTGREGIACSECIEGKAPAADGSCQDCGGSDSLPVVALAAIGISFICVLYQLVDRSSGNTAAPSQVLLMASIGFGQLLSVVQQLSVVALFAVTYEEPVDSFVRIFTIFTFDIEVLRVNCVGSLGPFGRYVLKVLSLATIAGIVIFNHLIFTFFARRGRSCLRALKARQSVLIGTLGVIVMGLFTTIVVTLLAPLQCNKHPNGRYSMAAYEDVICWEFEQHSEQTSMLILSAVVINGPLLFFIHVCYLVYVFPSRMRDLDASFLKSYGTLFLRFRVGAHWYIVVLISRALLIALIPIIRDAVTQIFILQVVLLSTQALCFLVKPWRVEKMNYLDAFLTLGMVFFCILASFNVEDVNTRGIGYLVVGMLCAAILVVPWLFVYVLYVKFGPVSRRYQYFLCHAKAEAGCFCRLLKMELQEKPQVKREVFLDADNLDTLDKLLTYVGNDLDTLLVLLSKSTLQRAWCAGEITVAHMRRVRTVPITLPSFEPFTEEQLASYLERCPNIELLSEAGLDPELVVEAIRRINGDVKLVMPTEADPRHASYLARRIVTGLHTGSMNDEFNTQSQYQCKHAGMSVALVVDFSSMEALASAGIIKKLLMPKVMHDEKSQHVDILSECDGLPESVRMTVLVCTNGCLQSLSVLATLFLAAERGLQALPIICEDHFIFPTAAMFKSLNMDELMPQFISANLSMRTKEDVIMLMRDIFKEIAVAMHTRSAPLSILMAAASEAALRILANSSATKSGDVYSPGGSPSSTRILSPAASETLKSVPSSSPVKSMTVAGQQIKAGGLPAEANTTGKDMDLYWTMYL